MKKKVLALLLSLVMVLSLVPALAFANDDTDPYVEDPFGDPVVHTNTHTVVHHAAVSSTCKDQGNIEYWYCEDCNAFFTDEGCTNEVNEDGVLLPLSTTHTTQLQNAQTATCTEAGYTGDEVCTVCGKTITTGSVIPKAAHTLTHHAAVAATETSEGNTEYWECSVCHKYFSDANGETEIAENSWVIPVVTQPSSGNENDPTGDDVFGHLPSHHVTAHAANASTCTVAGNSAYWYCQECEAYFSDAECTNVIKENSWVLPLADHVTELEGAVAATCTQNGYSGDQVCTVCGQTITEGHEIVAAGHAMVHTTATEATCTTAGNSEYYYCTTCQKYFSDANGENEIAENSWVIAAPGHSMTHHAAVAATETSEGNTEYWECSVCHKYFSDANGETEIAENSWIIPVVTTQGPYSNEGDNDPTGHDIFGEDHSTHNVIAHPAVASTCIAQGNSAYWYCEDCNKYYSDADCSVEIEENSWILPYGDHNTELQGAVAATCTQDGYSGDEVCTVCGQTITTGHVITAPGHAMVKVDAKPATCGTAGNTDYYYCTTCHKYFSDANGETEIAENSWVIAAPGHTLTPHAAVAATCTTAGNSAYWECTSCHKYFSDANGKTEIAANSWVIPASHTLVAHAAVAATCQAEGNSAYWECSVCHKYFSDANGENEIAENSWVLPLAAHSLEAVAEKPATCTAEGNSAYWICNVCGKFFSDANGENEIAENAWVTAPIGHNFVQTGYKAATVDKTGLITYTCSNCGEIKTVVIAKLDESKPLSPANAPTLAQAEKIIYATKGDEAPAGSLYNLLQLRATKATKNSLTLKWTKVKGATGYIIYGSPCGGKYKKFKSVKGSKTSLTLKKLKKGKYYKYFVVATTKYEGATKVIATSKTIHFATKGGKVGNYKAVKLTNVKKNKVSVKKGKTFKIKAKSIVQSKKLKVKKHRTLRYESTNSKVAKVDKNGKITAKKKGTCFVYVYDQSGNFAKIKVTVK